MNNTFDNRDVVPHTHKFTVDIGPLKNQVRDISIDYVNEKLQLVIWETRNADAHKWINEQKAKKKVDKESILLSVFGLSNHKLHAFQISGLKLVAHRVSYSEKSQPEVVTHYVEMTYKTLEKVDV